jgi:polysaccharide pyruvyl transferase WcaK-like protein
MTIVKRSLFLLVPSTGYTDNMPNLGDRALHAGITTLLKTSHQGPKLTDEWNSFSRLTWKRLSAGQVKPKVRFATWYNRYREHSDRSFYVQKVLSNLIFGRALGWIPVWPVIDRIAMQRTGQTGREAVAPRMFPGLAAQKYGANIAAADGVIMNGGGLLADHLVRYLPGRMFALHAALQAGRPTAIVNYSFAVTRPELLDWVAPVMRGITLHAVRESRSRERLLDIGVDPRRIMVTRDAAFATMPPTAPTLTSDTPTIAIQVRGDRTPDLDAWVELIAALRTRFGARVVYLAGCHKHDPPIQAALQQRSDLDNVGAPGNVDELKAAIAGSHVLITDRYHGLVFAAMTGTPFVPMTSTTLKTAGLVADLDYPGVVRAPLTRNGINAILDDVAVLLTSRATLSASLAQRSNRFRRQLQQDYKEIVATLLPKQVKEPNRRDDR